LGCTGPSEPTDQQAQELLKEGTVLVDVRTQEEFDAGHLQGAIHLPYEQILDLPQKTDVTQGSDIVVYCRSGRRSGIAKETLEQAGYKNVRNAGGYEDLKKQISQ